MHFDAAPLGFLSIAAHGHADCLSFLLHIDGKPILVDSGTYTYHTDQIYRSYFISTLAHNTVCVDKTNQAKMGGPTLWLNHYMAKTLFLETNDEYDLVEASHNGYEQIGVLHKRKVYFDKVKLIFEITDTVTITDEKKHTIEIPFHLHPDCKVNSDQENRYIVKRNGARSIKIETDPQLESNIVEGNKDPVLGWYSKSFLQKTPIKVIYCTGESKKTLVLKTTIKILN